MDDDRRNERAREFSRRELLRAGWVLPVVAIAVASCSDDGDWTGLRDRASAGQQQAQKRRGSAHADAEHIDSGTGVEHADLSHADAGAVAPEPTSPEPPASTRRGSGSGTTNHTDRAPHADVPVHWDTAHVDEHTDEGGPTDPEHVDAPYGDHTDSSGGFTVHDDSPHVDETFSDEALIDHGDVHVDVPHGDTIA
jgi:hypothetical protein